MELVALPNHWCFKMHTDTFVQAADWHRRQGVPCQDSVYGEVSGVNAILAISDGCSSGSGSEFGAQAITRILATSHWRTPLQEVANKLIQWKDLGKVDDGAMLATALRCTVDEDHDGDIDVTFDLQGDGIGGMLFEDGSTLSWCLEWNNTPPYLWYENSDLQKQWLAQAEPGVMRYWRNSELVQTIEVSPSDRRVWMKEAGDWKAIWLGSDGWLTLGLSVPEIAKEVTAYKNTEGAFLKRRLNRWLSSLSKKGIEPADDLSMVALIRE